MIVGLVQRQQDIWYGKALLPVLTNPAFKKLEPVRGKRTHYILNGERLLIVKQGKTRKRKDRVVWQFNFSSKEAKSLSEASNRNQKVFLCLVCHDTTVCTLTGKDAMSCLGNSVANRQLSIWVEKKSNSSWYTVTDFTQKGRFISKGSSRSNLSNYFYS